MASDDLSWPYESRQPEKAQHVERYEGYVDAKAEAGVEKAINRLVRWIVGTAIALGSVLIAIDRLWPCTSTGFPSAVRLANRTFPPG